MRAGTCCMVSWTPSACAGDGCKVAPVCLWLRPHCSSGSGGWWWWWWWWWCPPWQSAVRLLGQAWPGQATNSPPVLSCRLAFVWSQSSHHHHTHHSINMLSCVVSTVTIVYLHHLHQCDCDAASENKQGALCCDYVQ